MKFKLTFSETILFVILLLNTSLVLAQPVFSKALIPSKKNNPQNGSVHDKRTCGSMGYLLLQDSLNPSLKKERQAKQARLDSLTHYFLHREKSGRTLITIPVVVHVIYKNSDENLSFNQIQSQIDVLNRDFRKLNSDANQIPSVWNSVAADVEIEFCLAKRDPNGLPTDGILRVATVKPSFSMNDEMKFTNLGGSDAWPTDQYLNIWVCDLESGLLGYAQFPGGGSATTDGVVINNTNFGTEGTVVPPYHLGRTATHEIGHWLNLMHIWGDEPQCSADDDVNDTPQQKDSNGGCPSFPLTSGSGASCSDPNGAMFMNYMDYVHDNCMYMFTNGQKARMLAALNDYRQSITIGNACNALTPGDTLCDTASNVLPFHSLSQFRPSDVGANGDGWMSGTNSLGHKAKADYFNLQLNSWQGIHGVYIDFGYAFVSNPNTVIQFTLWEDNGPAGSPGTALASRSIPLGSIATQIQAGLPVYLVFSPAVGTDGSFYAGVEYPPSGADSIAVFTNDIGQSTINTAWEQWSDNTWHAYTEPSSWQLSLSHAISPVYCAVVGLPESPIPSSFHVFPVPADRELHIRSFLPSSDLCLFEIFDFSGRQIIAKSVFLSSDETIQLNTSDFTPGFYNLRIHSAEKFANFKFLVVHP